MNAPEKVNPLLLQWHNTLSQFSDSSVLLDPGGAWVTYSDLDKISDAISLRIKNSGILPGAVINVQSPRGLFWPAAILGIWKAGCSYFASTSQNSAIVESFMRRIGCDTILKPEAGSAWDLQRITLSRIDSYDCLGEFKRFSFPGCCAYALASSGTTGDPKIAMISQETCSSVMAGISTECGINFGETALHSASFGFSSSVRQIFCPIFSGARLVISQDSGASMGPAMLDEIKKHNISHIDLTPSQIKIILKEVSHGNRRPHGNQINRVLVASEIFTSTLARDVRLSMPEIKEIFHLYGKTETGGAVSIRKLEVDDFEERCLPLNVPFSPFKMRVRLTVGGASELLIGGLNERDLTITKEGVLRSGSKIDEEDNSLWHETGDLISHNRSKTFGISGRKDDLVKILGRIVDLSSIGVSVSSGLAVNAVFLDVVRRGDGGDVIRVVYSSSLDLPEKDVSYFCRIHFPNLPFIALRLEQLPLLASGKIDRVALQQSIVGREAQSGICGDHKRAVLENIWRERTFSEPNHKINDTDDFIQSGGDSLSVVGFISDIFKKFGIRVGIEEFLNNPTIGFIYDLVRNMPDIDSNKFLSGLIPIASREMYYPTHFQKALWLTEKIQPRKFSPYWLTIGFQVDCVIDRQKLEDSAKEILRCHDLLCTGFIENDKFELKAVPGALVPDYFKVHPLSDIEYFRYPSFVGDATPSDLFFVFFETDNLSQSRVQILVHHAVIDRQGLYTILEDLSATYSLGEHPSRKSSVSVLSRFVDFCHRETLSLELEAKTFWESRLTKFNGDKRKRAGIDFGTTDVFRFTVNFERLPLGATLNAVLMTAYNHVISSLDLPFSNIIGVDIDFRSIDLHGLVGPFSNPFPIVFNDPGDFAFSARSVTNEILKVIQYSALPVRKFFPSGFCVTNDLLQPLYLYKMVFQREQFPDVSFEGEAVGYTILPQGISEHDFTLFVRSAGLDYEISATYNRDYVSESIAENIVNSVIELLKNNLTGQ